MSTVSLGQVLLFCGAVLVPLIICVLFAHTQFNKYEETKARRYLIGLVGGTGVAISCGLYIGSVILQYFEQIQQSKTVTVIATGVALMGAGLIAISSLREWQIEE